MDETGYQVTLKPEPAPGGLSAFKGRFSDTPKGAKKILSEIAETILDGSVPFEEALKAAKEKLENVDLSELSDDLEKALEDAMYEAAARATGKAK